VKRISPDGSLGAVRPAVTVRVSESEGPWRLAANNVSAQREDSGNSAKNEERADIPARRVPLPV